MEQTEGKFTHLCLSAGTGGTLTGTAKKVKELCPHVRQTPGRAVHGLTEMTRSIVSRWSHQRNELRVVHVGSNLHFSVHGVLVRLR